MSIRFLFALAVLPAFLLGLYIYKKDRTEKEPPGLLFALAGMGALATVCAMIAELVFNGLENIIFDLDFTADDSDVSWLSPITAVIYYFIQAFLIVAPAEEGFKWLFTRIITAKNRNFDSLFDGVVYCVFTSLGFAAVENVGYVFRFGPTVALTRAITSVPGHMFFGVIMGYFYSRWHIRQQAGVIEKRCAELNYIEPPAENSFNTRGPLIKSLLAPILVHGAYDFFLFVSAYAEAYGTNAGRIWSVLLLILFYIILIGMYIYCFLLIRKESAMDTFSGRLALGQVINKYPHLIEKLPGETVNYLNGVTPQPVYTQTRTMPQPPYVQPQANPYNQPQTPPYPPQQANPYNRPQTPPYPPQQTNPYNRPQTPPYPPQQANPYNRPQTPAYSPRQTMQASAPEAPQSPAETETAPEGTR